MNVRVFNLGLVDPGDGIQLEDENVRDLFVGGVVSIVCSLGWLAMWWHDRRKARKTVVARPQLAAA